MDSMMNYHIIKSFIKSNTTINKSFILLKHKDTWFPDMCQDIIKNYHQKSIIFSHHWTVQELRFIQKWYLSKNYKILS